ncbi:MAG: YraN family protein [Candidatus Scalindua sp.]|nr:YraN family protein [Candidatus Scalindua sp.]
MDIVAYDRGTIVFVEVKARLSEDFGTPELAVTSEKRRRIIKTALHYLMVNNISDMDYRFDIVSIVFTKEKKHPKIELFRGAFTSVGFFDRY